MKQKFLSLLACVLFGAVCATAQVRIGGTVAPNQSAVLDLNPTDDALINKAFVLPRVNLQATTTQTLAETLTGMTVYNMTTVNDVTPGIYYWDGAKWVRIPNKFGDLINYSDLGDSIAFNISNTSLKDSIINLIHANEIDGVIGNEVVGASDNTLIRTGAGTYADPYKLKVDIEVIGNRLLEDNHFVTNMGDSIAKYITFTDMGDSILTYITNNVNQELTDSIMRHVTVDGTRGITVDGSGTSHITINMPTGTKDEILSFDGNKWVSTNISTFTVTEVDGVIGNEVTHALDATAIVAYDSTNELGVKVSTAVVGDSLVNNSTFVNNMGNKLVNNNSFINNMGDKLVDNSTYVTNMGNNIAKYFNTTDLGDTIFNHIVNNFDRTVQGSTNISFGDSIANYIANHYNDTYLGDTIAAHITKEINYNEFGDSLALHISHELTDSIFSNAKFTGSQGVVVTQQANHPSNVNVGLPTGTQNQILSFDVTSQKWRPVDISTLIKRVEITIDGSSANNSIESRILVGNTSTTAKNIQIISVQPEIITTGGFDEELDLQVSTTAKISSGGIRWSVRLANENYIATRKFGVAKVYVYYICEDTLTHNTVNSRTYTQPITSVKTVNP